MLWKLSGLSQARHQVSAPHLVGAQLFPDVLVAAVVDPSGTASREVGLRHARSPIGSGRPRGYITRIPDPVDASQAEHRAGAPPLHERLASFVPIAFKAVDELQLRGDLRRQLPCRLEGATMRGELHFGYLALEFRIHAGGQREVVGGGEDAAPGGGSGPHVLLERGLAVGEAGMGVAVDDGR